MKRLAGVNRGAILRTTIVGAIVALALWPRADLKAGPDAFTGFGSVPAGGGPVWIWSIKPSPKADVVAQDYSVALTIGTAATNCEVSEEGPAVDYFHHRTGLPASLRTCDDFIAKNLMGPAVTRILICKSPSVPVDALVTYAQNVGDCH